MIETDGKLAIDVGPIQVRVPERTEDAARAYKEKKVIFGIRPEDIHDPDFTPPGVDSQNVPAEVEVTELMGNEVFLNLKTEDLTYVARVDPRTSAEVGSQVEAAFNVGNMHLFDAETENAIR